MNKTTVTISNETAKKIDKMSKENGISKRELLEVVFNYFGKNGINPLTHESPSAEIEKITKRFNQFFAFFKKQEKDLLIPVFAKADETNQLSKKFATDDDLKELAKAERLEQLVKVYKSLDENLRVVVNYLKQEDVKKEQKRTRQMISEMFQAITTKDRIKENIKRIKDEY